MIMAIRVEAGIEFLRGREGEMVIQMIMVIPGVDEEDFRVGEEGEKILLIRFRVIRGEKGGLVVNLREKKRMIQEVGGGRMIQMITAGQTEEEEVYRAVEEEVYRAEEEEV